MIRRCRSCDQAFPAEGNWQRLCWDCWHRLRAQERNPGTIVVGPFDAELLKLAITLCHPDKHPPERAALCNRVTAALIDALKTVREQERRTRNAA